jgi:hypothetical protein
VTVTNKRIKHSVTNVGVSSWESVLDWMACTLSSIDILHTHLLTDFCSTLNNSHISVPTFYVFSPVL